MRSCLFSLMGMSHHFFPWLVEQQSSSVRAKSLKHSHVVWECTRYRERKTSTKPSGNRKRNQLAAPLSWRGASPATHAQEAFACGGDHSKVKDVPRLDPPDRFPKEQPTTISASVGLPPPPPRKDAADVKPVPSGTLQLCRVAAGASGSMKWYLLEDTDGRCPRCFRANLQLGSFPGCSREKGQRKSASSNVFGWFK